MPSHTHEFPADSPDDGEVVDERDLLELLTTLVDKRDTYEAIIKGIATRTAIDAQGVYTPIDTRLSQEILRGAYLENEAARLDIQMTQEQGAQHLTSLKVRSMDGPPLTVHAFDTDTYVVTAPYDDICVITRDTLQSLLSAHSEQASSQLDITSIHDHSVESDIRHSFELRDDTLDVTLSGEYVELETPTNSVFSFEVTIQHPHPSGKLAGTRLLVTESLDKSGSPLSIDHLEPANAMFTLVRLSTSPFNEHLVSFLEPGGVSRWAHS